MAKKNQGNKGGRIQPGGNNRHASLKLCKLCNPNHFYLKQYPCKEQMK